jgi:hypothetical protein
MNGNLMYEVARQQIAERQRAARQAGQAREQRAAARGRQAKNEKRELAAVPAIPDFADEMFHDAERGAVPAPRAEAGRGRHARTQRR